MAMSAANAAEDNNVAAPAAMKDFTLRMGSVLLSGEADYKKAPLQNSRTGRWHQMFKRRLTLIFKVDNLSLS
ncbi:hypothetical protein [Bradyrhizobium sp. BWA-3-5]|uniref:hypothetical protein n=1 Tax=Bradyrhizobium sp. BWA-3-5 TaxID=3080013 RepID=UPI00293F22FA|nr:hypothetical protein [Bradyrhizobium sp. BWA-3-5]WOH70090.1 hypothetical protein RX331_06770 [Bradyrhizobium sp. BWA-3-5]